ncbi:MAG: CRTAC1 family protein [Planctomycetaceae bacterium]|nr:CRTAC1 family protein [Planctomycetaceae bacterium]
MLSRRLALLLCLGLLVPGCNSSSAPPKRENTAVTSSPDDTFSAPSSIAFRDATQTLGVDWTYRNGEEAGNFSIVESMGGGLALCDFDQDGRLDLVAAGGGSFPRPREIAGLPIGLFRQTPAGQFEDVSQPATLAGSTHYNHGIAAGDYDNDGFPDIAVTGFGGISLFRNLGDGTFQREDLWRDLFSGGWSITAGWGDVNRDGHPDLVVVHYADWSFDNDPPCPGPASHPRDVCPPRRFRGLADQLFLSDGQGGFREVGREAGLRSERKGIGLAIADLDLDGDLDVYVANDTEPNDFYRNDGRGHFDEIGLPSGVALSADGNADGSMGVDVGDLNGDGLPDIWVTNFERETFALYQNLGGCQFQHVSRIVGVSSLPGTYVGWGTVLLDADGDGDEDLFVTNGHVVRFPTHSPVRQLPLLLENREGERFRNVADTVGPYFREPHPGRGVAVGDIDGDGDPDLAVSHVNEPIAMLLNESPEWRGIALRLIGRSSPRQRVGPVVRLTVGTRTVVQQLKCAASYASTSSDTLFFGRGRDAAARLEIDWPSGTKQILETIPDGPLLTIIEPR